MTAEFKQASQAYQLCPQEMSFLDSANADSALSYLCDEAETAEQGWAAMKYLRENREDVANEVLCILYDVAVKPLASGDDLLWSVPLTSGAALHQSLSAARSFAVDDLQLVEKFFEPF